MDVYEFVGPRRAGKTTLIRLLTEQCQAKGLRVASNCDRLPIRAMATPSTERLMFRLIIATQAVELYHRCLQEAPPPDILFLDRGWNDLTVWSELERARDAISPQERTALQTLFTDYRKRVRRTIYLTIPPALALERQATSPQQPVDHLAGRPEFMAMLHKAYEDHWVRLHRPYRVDGRRPMGQLVQEVARLIAS